EVQDMTVLAGEWHRAYESIAENLVSQVPDVGVLVGIYAGVLSQKLAGGNLALGLCIRSECGRHLFTLYACVDVARAGDVHFFKAFDWPDFSNDLFRDLAWRLAKFFGQLEGERKSVLPEFDF